MNFKILKSNFFHIIFIGSYAFIINWFSGNQGVMPIDTFGFFDTGFSILKNKFPIKDFWIFTGLIVDYFQALFFLIFGSNWTAYIIHASFFNILISLTVYFSFINLKLNKIYSSFYALSVATLCYPVMGTPFAYQHSFIISLISIFIFCLAIKKQSNILWFCLPISMSLAFLAMQTPSSYINLVIIIISFYYFISEKKIHNLKYFILGSLTIIFSFFIFLLISETALKDFVYQYILFPLSIGSGRILNDQSAYTGLVDQINFKRLILDFKFIHIFLLPLTFLIIKDFLGKYKIKESYLITSNILILISTFLFIFHQLLTANQIFIFALIPILAGFLHINLDKNYDKYYLKIFVIFLVILVTIKYHYRFNVERKFIDLENINLEKAIKAEVLSPKLKNLKWITPLYYSKQKEEIDFIKNVIKHLKEDKRKKMVITHYQFFSLILNEDLNILNRWYLDNNTHPTKNHKYFPYYKEFVNNSIERNKVEIIYLVSSHENEMTFEKVKVYFTEKCFKNNILINGKFSSLELKDCN